MRTERQTPCPTILRGRFIPIPRQRVANNCDDAIRELRKIWPTTVDLAKEPGTLYRLHALLNS